MPCTRSLFRRCKILHRKGGIYRLLCIRSLVCRRLSCPCAFAAHELCAGVDPLDQFGVPSLKPAVLPADRASGGLPFRVAGGSARSSAGAWWRRCVHFRAGLSGFFDPHECDLPSHFSAPPSSRVPHQWQCEWCGFTRWLQSGQCHTPSFLTGCDGTSYLAWRLLQSCRSFLLCVM